MDWTAVIVAIIGSGALSGIVSAVIANMKDCHKRDAGIVAGVRELLYDRIKHLGKSYISHGCVTPEELEDLISMHQIYHNDLNGNGFLDSLMATVKSLPIENKGV